MCLWLTWDSNDACLTVSQLVCPTVPCTVLLCVLTSYHACRQDTQGNTVVFVTYPLCCWLVTLRSTTRPWDDSGSHTHARNRHTDSVVVANVSTCCLYRLLAPNVHCEALANLPKLQMLCEGLSHILALLCLGDVYLLYCSSIFSFTQPCSSWNLKYRCVRPSCL